MQPNDSPKPFIITPKAIECKAKRDVQGTWNPRLLPLYKQKPAAITKQKADAQRKIKRRNAERARSLDISLPDELLNSGQ